jgi:hypothetical protein
LGLKNAWAQTNILKAFFEASNENRLTLRKKKDSNDWLVVATTSCPERPIGKPDYLPILRLSRGPYLGYIRADLLRDYHLM